MIIFGSLKFFTLFALGNMLPTVSKAEFVECPPGTQFNSIATTGERLWISDFDDESEFVGLPFTFPWLDTVFMSELTVSTNGMVYPIEGQPRFSVIEGDLNPSQGNGIYVGGDANAYTISYEEVPFYQDGGSLNGQITLYPTGSVDLCYGDGSLPDHETFTARIQDEHLEFYFPARTYPTNVFDSSGKPKGNHWPANTCACFRSGFIETFDDLVPGTECDDMYLNGVHYSYGGPACQSQQSLVGLDLTNFLLGAAQNTLRLRFDCPQDIVGFQIRASIKDRNWDQSAGPFGPFVKIKTFEEDGTRIDSRNIMLRKIDGSIFIGSSIYVPETNVATITIGCGNCFAALFAVDSVKFNSDPRTCPTPTPTALPTASPTPAPTDIPTLSPTISPTASPTHFPTDRPTASPTSSPTVAPTRKEKGEKAGR